MESGLILLNKPQGTTSFDALRDIKRSFGTGKVGHTGTLDKFAGGLLLVLAGKALKLSRWFSHCDKKYTGKIFFGAETDTLDPEGKITAEAALPSREAVSAALRLFTGDIMQEPPAYSAIHVNGKRASSLARSGIIPEMIKRKVTVYALELLSWEPPFAEIFVHCSSGTYIRSLARDIALAADSRGHLVSLLRTEIAGFTLDMAVNKKGSWESGVGSRKEDDYSCLLPTPYSLFPIDKDIISKIGLPWFDVSEKEANAICHGKQLTSVLNEKQLSSLVPSCLYVKSSQDHLSAAVFYGETLIAVIEKIEDNWKYGCVM